MELNMLRLGHDRDGRFLRKTDATVKDFGVRDA